MVTKKRKIITTVIILILAVGAALMVSHNKTKSISIFNGDADEYVGKIRTQVVRDGYIEHAFDLPSSQDVYTRLALEKIIKTEKNLTANARPVVLPEWQYIEQAPPLAWSGSWRVNGDVYEFRPSTTGVTTPTEFNLYQNNKLLFTFKGEYGAEGPIIQKVIVNKKPGFTLRTAYDAGSLHSKYDIYYDGKLLSIPEKNIDTSVNNPHYLFSYNNKIGFINDGGEHAASIVYNGRYITNNFDVIHFENCCVIQELLPTVYDNGILVFYAKRGNQNYIVEVDLKTL